MEPIRAVGLISGGLDSMLAVRLVQELGVEVLGLHLRMPTACCTRMDEVAARLGIPLEVRPMGDDYLRLLRRPRFGYGRNLNPCVDCRIFMFRMARDYMEEVAARFLCTGEVLGQRPMSQMRRALATIERQAGLEGRVLRPLSARHLPPTEPERRGWVDRSRLLAIEGRGRREQLELARRYGFHEYSSPAGGCLLTDAGFSSRLRDLFGHVPEEALTQEDVLLLRVGRHFRLGPNLKLIVGRSAEENRQLFGFLREGRACVEAALPWKGPSVLVCGPLEPVGFGAALRLMVRFSKQVPPGAQATVWRSRTAAQAVEVADGASAEGDAWLATCPLAPMNVRPERSDAQPFAALASTQGMGSATAPSRE